MRSRINILFVSLMLVSLVSCEEDLLHQEHYKPVIYLKSGDNNIFQYPHSLNDSISTGYITAGSGGSMPLAQDVSIRIQLDTVPLHDYNYRNYGNERSKYAKLLPPDCYVIPYDKIVIKAGDINATAFLPVEVDANRLSPDTTYMLPLKIESAQELEINEDKSFILYQVDLMNDYASPTSNVYKMRGTKQQEGGIKSNITSSKKVVPLSRNKIRMFPENLIVSKKLETIRDNCMILAIDSDNSVHVRAYQNIKIEQLEDCFYDPAHKVFTIHYRYRLPNDPKWTTVTETLTRIE